MARSSKAVAIMTWYTYHNYGTALQVAALNRKLRQMGYVPEVVQYIPRLDSGATPEINARWAIDKVHSKLMNFFNGSYESAERKELFEDFLRREIRETALCSNFCELHDLNEEFGAFICGSDQIWSPLCYDDKYFLSFVDDPQRMVAYAPSIGSTEIREKHIREEMCKLIERFVHLSVREKQGAELIHRLTGREAKVVLDPTLLLTQEEWADCAGSAAASSLPKQKYILCYFLGDDRRYMRYVKQISKALHLPYYVIPVNRRQYRRKDRIPFEVGPDDFVTLIRNAGYVCTDSFHGMVFSINHSVPFSVFERFKKNDPRNQNSRITSLLSLLGLEARIVSENQKFSALMRDCDFSEANRNLVGLRAESEKFLEGALLQAMEFKHLSRKYTPWKIADLCCGCGACAAVCPKKAISMFRDNEGFWHYSVDNSVCVGCGKCHKVCPMMHISARDIHEANGLYSMKSSSEEVLLKSSSGGIGHEIAKVCMKCGMNVCGCAYNANKNSAEHIIISKGDERRLPLLQGSKYIQSQTVDAMEWISCMGANEKVAFFGTPCQVAAVDKLLKDHNLRENALLVDLICHGVPSAYLWEKYLQEVNSDCGTGENPGVEFRNKAAGWQSLTISVSGNGHVYHQSEMKDDFYAFFRRSLCYMESCYECPYREKSAADIRIGDYWGPRFTEDKQGVSMVIANSDSGYSAIRKLIKSGECSAQSYPLDEYWFTQFPYNKRKPFVRESVIKDLKTNHETLSQMKEKYCTNYDTYERIQKMKLKAKKILRRG